MGVGVKELKTPRCKLSVGYTITPIHPLYYRRRLHE